MLTDSHNTERGEKSRPLVFAASAAAAHSRLHIWVVGWLCKRIRGVQWVAGESPHFTPKDFFADGNRYTLSFWLRFPNLASKVVFNFNAPNVTSTRWCTKVEHNFIKQIWSPQLRGRGLTIIEWGKIGLRRLTDLRQECISEHVQPTSTHIHIEMRMEEETVMESW